MHATTYTRPWVDRYPPDVAPDISFEGMRSVLGLVADSVAHHPDHTAITCLGSDISYCRLYADCEAVAAWFGTLGLALQARVALMMPSCPQYVVCQLALMRAGLVAVNVNPLYTSHELVKQLSDSGASAIIVLKNFAATVEAALREVPVAHVVVSSLGDMLGWAKGTLVNTVSRYVKKVVPPGVYRGIFATPRCWPRAASGRHPSAHPIWKTWPCCDTPVAPRARPRARC